MGQDIPLDVDAWCHLDQLKPSGDELEHAPLGYIESRLAPLQGIFAGVGPVLYLGNELAAAALTSDLEPPLRHPDLEPTGCERAGEHHALGVLADVDEAPGARKPGAELRDVEVAVRIGLRQAEDREVKPAPVVEIELVGLIDNRIGIDRGAEVARYELLPVPRTPGLGVMMGLEVAYGTMT